MNEDDAPEPDADASEPEATPPPDADASEDAEHSSDGAAERSESGFEWTDGVADDSTEPADDSSGSVDDEDDEDDSGGEAPGEEQPGPGLDDAADATADREPWDPVPSDAPSDATPPEAAVATDSRGVTVDGFDDGADDEEAFGATYGVRRAVERNPEAVLTRPDRASGSLERISRADLREHYGPVRTFFKRREAAYGTYKRKLTQAWVRSTYDQYLSTVVARAAAVLALFVAVGLATGIGLVAAARAGVVPDPVPGVGLAAEPTAGLALGGVVALGLLAAAAYWAWYRIARIHLRIAGRRREIEYNLPYAVTFMYALARADVNFDRIVARLADATETYGAVAQEFDRVVRDVEMFGNNLYVGLENLRAVTPSEELGRFTDDLMTVLETGGDLAGFLRDEVDDKLDAAVAAQEQYIERLELLSEVFVVGFVAAPLFVLVVLIVVGFLGAETLTVIVGIVYVGIPVSLAGFVVLVDAVSEPFTGRAVSFDAGRAPPEAPPETPQDPEWRERYERDKRISGLRNRLREQVGRVSEEPGRAFLFSVPVAIAIPALAVLYGGTPASLDALLADPVALSTALFVVPLVVATTPVALLYERRIGRERAFQRRFPDLLELLATSNRRGLSISRSLDIVTDAASGPLGDELQALRNDIRWNADLPGAFEAFGDRLTSPALTRTVNLIAEGSRATSDLHVVLEVAATDTAERVRLERERRQTLQSYLVIVVVGFLVYLLVVLLLAANFLDPIEALDYSTAAAQSAPVSLGDVPVDELRLVLFHSALIQGFGSGVLAGKLAENSLYSGLKYGIGLAVLAVLAFGVV